MKKSAMPKNLHSREAKMLGKSGFDKAGQPNPLDLSYKPTKAIIKKDDEDEEEGLEIVGGEAGPNTSFSLRALL